MNIFRRSRDHAEEAPAVPEIREARQFLPSSAKSPDAQRLMLFNPDEEIDEATDQDLAFLNSLVAGTEAEPGEPPRRRAAPPTRPAAATPVAEPMGDERADDMALFRESAAMRQREEIAKYLQVEHVDMGDLLEELATTRAALRYLRKAA